MSNLSPKARWISAWNDLKATPGIHTFENRESCCRSCASYEMSEELGEGSHNVVWTFNGQGAGIQFIDHQPFSIPEEYEEEEVEEGVWEAREDDPEPVASFYIYFSEADEDNPTAAPAAKKAFEANGFQVEWDGSLHTALEVTF